MIDILKQLQEIADIYMNNNGLINPFNCVMGEI